MGSIKTPNSLAIVVQSGSTAPTLQTKTVTPSSVTQTISPSSGYDGFSSFTVNGDSNLTSENIKSGISIFGISGSYQGKLEQITNWTVGNFTTETTSTVNSLPLIFKITGNINLNSYYFCYISYSGSDNINNILYGFAFSFTLSIGNDYNLSNNEIIGAGGAAGVWFEENNVYQGMRLNTAEIISINNTTSFIKTHFSSLNFSGRLSTYTQELENYYPPLLFTIKSSEDFF